MPVNVLAIVPARAGSKGLKNKNAQKIAGDTLTMRALKCAKSVTPYVILSSDSNALLEEASYSGYTVHYPIDPYNGVQIHSDECRAWDVWREAVHWYETVMMNNVDWPVYFDCHLYLEPTSPFRTEGDLRHAMHLINEEGEDMVFSVTEDPGCPFKNLVMGSQGLVEDGLCDDLNNPPRQIFPPTYKRNGAFYACTDHYLKESDSIITANVSRMEVLKGEYYMNIDTAEDLKNARVYLD